MSGLGDRVEAFLTLHWVGGDEPIEKLTPTTSFWIARISVSP